MINKVSIPRIHIIHKTKVMDRKKRNNFNNKRTFNYSNKNFNLKKTKKK